MKKIINIITPILSIAILILPVYRFICVDCGNFIIENSSVFLTFINSIFNGNQMSVVLCQNCGSYITKFPNYSSFIVAILGVITILFGIYDKNHKLLHITITLKTALIVLLLLPAIEYFAFEKSLMQILHGFLRKGYTDLGIIVVLCILPIYIIDLVLEIKHFKNIHFSYSFYDIFLKKVFSPYDTLYSLFYVFLVGVLFTYFALYWNYPYYTFGDILSHGFTLQLYILLAIEYFFFRSKIKHMESTNSIYI